MASGSPSPAPATLTCRLVPDRVTKPIRTCGTQAEEAAAYEEQRHKQSSERICVEHANADLKKWRPLQRYLGNRDDFDETFQAIAGLVSDRAAAR